MSGDCVFCLENGGSNRSKCVRMFSERELDIAWVGRNRRYVQAEQGLTAVI